MAGPHFSNPIYLTDFDSKTLDFSSWMQLWSCLLGLRLVDSNILGTKWSILPFLEHSLVGQITALWNIMPGKINRPYLPVFNLVHSLHKADIKCPFGLASKSLHKCETQRFLPVVLVHEESSCTFILQKHVCKLLTCAKMLSLLSLPLSADMHFSWACQMLFPNMGFFICYTTQKGN